jgi:hypothetical protein
MQVLYTRCCGLDVHKETVVARRLLTFPNGRIDKQIRTFSTMTRGLLELKQWLQEEQVSHVAMESTGVFTPPTILPMVGGTVKREWNRHGTHTEDNTDLLLIDLHPFDQSANDVPACLKIHLLQPNLHLSRKGLQTP